MAIRVGRWDCQHCGHIGNLGPHTQCESCGASRPENVVFYLPKDAEIVTQSSEIRKAKSGADWVCGHCESHNKTQDIICLNCGNPRDEKSEDVTIQEKEYTLDSVPEVGEKAQGGTGETYRKNRPELQPRKRKVGKGMRRILALPVVGAIVMALLRAFPAEVPAEVVAFRWERSIQFEHYEAVAKEDWQVPNDAWDISSFRAVHHYDRQLRGYENRTRTVREKVGEERYVCGQKDLGNGYFEDVYCTRPIYESREETYREPVYDQIPVYKTKYRFKVREWVQRRQYFRHVKGFDQQAYWPETPQSQHPERWRPAQKKEAYYLTVEVEGERYEERVGPRFWSHLSQGSQLTAQRARFFGYYFGIVDEGKNN